MNREDNSYFLKINEIYSNFRIHILFIYYTLTRKNIYIYNILKDINLETASSWNKSICIDTMFFLI